MERMPRAASVSISAGDRALLMAGGVLALSGSVLLFATTPIRASLSTDGETVHAQLHASF